MKIFILHKREIDIKPYINILKRNGLKTVNDVKLADFICILGGDGMVLKVLKYILIKNIPIFAVNYGKLGYLANINKDEFEIAIKKIKNKKYRIDKRQLLEIDIINSKKKKKFFALNDLCIMKGSLMAKLIDVNVYDITDKKEFINRYRADGLILSTPTGSTAYSLSAGGSILYRNLKATILTAICPQTLSAVPIVISGDRKLEFSFIEKGYRDVVCHIDGFIHVKLNYDSIIKAKLSDKDIQLINLDNNNYYEILREKLNWGKNIVE